MTQDDTHDLENILDALKDAAKQADSQLTVGEMLDAFAERSFGALLSVVALVAALPVIGAIPGVSIVTGTLILVIAAQVLIGRDTPWTPAALRKLSVGADAMESGVEKVRPYAASIDSLIRPRLTFLTKGPLAQGAIAVAAVGLALLFYPMALIPGGVWAPSLAILALGLALVGNDGVLALIGAAGVAATLGLIYWFVL